MSTSTSSLAAETNPATEITVSARRISPKDNWYGLADAEERRKRQNRLNQRAHRLRKHQKDLENARPRVHLPISRPTPRDSAAAATAPELHHGREPRPSSSVAERILEIPSDWKRHILLRRLAEFHSSYALNCPTADHLITLTRVNVYRAFVNNMVSLGITWEWMEDDSISPFTMVRPGSELAIYPPSLNPTSLQQRRIHHTWIDFFPHPVMRDNLLNRENDSDDEDLCTDIMGFWEGSATGPNSLIVWGEPSDPANWEITEGFLGKWGWVVDGCEEVMRATNYWRAQRGEEPLFLNE
ncbi:hypothetical protein BDV59DRAFT_145444 [Aspergillus ambiguus]|uniref:bZIP transcription factor n=1 Tax=Aspergillus ambiguus TaxID=176160 RepID=UPI003CCC986D